MTHLDAYTGAGDGQTCPTEANGAFLRAAQQRPRSAAWPLTKKGQSGQRLAAGQIGPIRDDACGAIAAGRRP
jgi:hypothetical protein